MLSIKNCLGIWLSRLTFMSLRFMAESKLKNFFLIFKKLLLSNCEKNCCRQCLIWLLMYFFIGILEYLIQSLFYYWCTHNRLRRTELQSLSCYPFILNIPSLQVAQASVFSKASSGWEPFTFFIFHVNSWSPKFFFFCFEVLLKICILVPHDQFCWIFSGKIHIYLDCQFLS